MQSETGLKLEGKFERQHKMQSETDLKLEHKFKTSYRSNIIMPSHHIPALTQRLRRKQQFRISLSRAGIAKKRPNPAPSSCSRILYARRR